MAAALLTEFWSERLELFFQAKRVEVKAIYCPNSSLHLFLKKEIVKYIDESLWSFFDFGNNVENLRSYELFVLEGSSEFIGNILSQLDETFSTRPIIALSHPVPHCQMGHSLLHLKKLFIVEPASCETALRKTKQVLEDNSLGEILSASLTATGLPLGRRIAFSETEAMTSLVASIRSLFGEIISATATVSASTVLCICKDRKEQVIGATIQLIENPSSEIFELLIKGSSGNFTLSWNNQNTLFETRRNLNAFEHPTFFPATGYEWSLSVVLDSIGKTKSVYKDSDGKILQLKPTDLFTLLVPMAIAEGLKESKGSAIVAFQPSCLYVS